MKKKFLRLFVAMGILLFSGGELGVWGENTIGTFVKITTLSDLEDGSYYVLFGESSPSYNGAMSCTLSSGFMKASSVTITNETITNPDNTIIWKLNGNFTNGWTLYNEAINKYLEINVDKTNGFALSTKSSQTYNVTYETAKGFFFMSNDSKASNRGISIYQNDFRCYKESSKKTMYLFKKMAHSVPAPEITPAETTFTTSTYSISISAKDTCKVYYTTDNSTPTTASTLYSGPFTINASAAPITVKAIAVGNISGKSSSMVSKAYTYSSAYVVVGQGTFDNPYTVEDVIELNYNIKGENWIRGTIIGTIVDKYSIINSSGASNVAIGTTSAYIGIKLIDKSDPRAAININDNPNLLNKEILIKGALVDYFGHPGVTDVVDFRTCTTVTVSDAGYATMILDYPVAIPQGMNVYYVDNVIANKLNFVKFNAPIPARTGVLLEAAAGNYTFYYTGATPATVTNNLFKGATKDEATVSKTNDYIYYILGKKNGVVGFYYPNGIEENSKFTSAKGKAYLEIPTAMANSIQAFSLEHHGEATAIETPKVEKSETVYYDLLGRRIPSPAKGIYLMNGKKVFVK